MLTTLAIISIISMFFIVVADVKKRVIPDVWLWPILLAGMAAHGGEPDYVVAAAAGYILGFALMMVTLKREALGFGDVKLLAVSGLWLGVQGLSVSVVTACVVGIACGLSRKQKYIPFAPFMAIGAATYFLTKEIMTWLI